MFLPTIAIPNTRMKRFSFPLEIIKTQRLFNFRQAYSKFRTEFS